MKTRKLIGIAALLFALGVTGCGENPDPEVPACEHEYQYVQGTGDKADYHWEVCTKCNEIKDKSEKKHSFKDNAAKESSNKAATCEAAGSKWQICACGVEKETEVKALGHKFNQLVSTTSTCEEAGQKTMKCERCTATEVQDDVALGHNWVDDSSFTPIAQTCVDKGVKQQKCDRPGCSKTQRIETDALGHKFVDSKGTPVDGYATVNSSACERGDSTRIFWSAKDLTDTCKNDKRLAREATEEAEAFYEPNYVDVDEEGIRFWGRPIRNAMTLSDEGRSSSSDHVSVFDPTVTGSYFEYKFMVTTAIPNAMLIAEYAPTSDLGTGDLYKANSGDWTPGLESDGNGGSNKLAYRFEIKVDADTLVFDGSDNKCPGSDRAWFQFPTNAVALGVGEHTLRISMAGGYLHTWYNFGFQSADVSTGHVHNFVKDLTLSTEPDCENDGRFYGVCECGIISDRVVSRLGHLLVEEEKAGVTATPTCIAKGAKFEKCTRPGCNYEKTTELDMVDHTYEAYAGDATHVPVTANKCKDGLHFEKCSVCNDIKSVVDPAPEAHAFGEADATTGIATCGECGCKKIEKAVTAVKEGTTAFPTDGKWAANTSYSWSITVDGACTVKIFVQNKLGSGKTTNTWGTYTISALKDGAETPIEGTATISGKTYGETGIIDKNTLSDIEYGYVTLPEAGTYTITIGVGTYNYRNIADGNIIFIL